MKPFYPVLLLLALCMNAAAQTTKRISALQPYTEGKLYVKLNLFSMLDPEVPTIQPGIEYRFHKRLTGEFTIGLPTPLSRERKPTDSTYYRYYKLKAELKFFPGDSRSFYIGPEISFVNKDRSLYDHWLQGENGKTYSYDYAKLDKSIYTLAIKIGQVIPFKNNHRWFMDVFFGVGMRFVHLDVDAVNFREEPHSGWMFWPEDRQGTSTTMHMTLGLKFGHVLH